MRISRIRLSDKTSRLHPRLAAPKLGQADESEAPVEVREGIRPAPASPDLVLVAQPPAQPRSGVVVEHTVGPVGRPYPRVVCPAAQARFNCCTNSVVLAPVHPTTAAPRTPRYPRTLVHPRPARPDWSGTGHRQREEYPRGRACRTGHRSDSWAQPSLSRVMPSAVSEPFSELIGCPISWSLTTSCCLELGPLALPGFLSLPSPPPQGARPPSRASGWPSLTTPRGFPCCLRFPGVHAVATTPAQRLGACFAHFPSPISLPRSRSQVGLRIVLVEACSAFTRVTACTLALSPIRDTLHQRLQPFRYLHSCSGCFRLERLPGGTFTHWESAAFARRTLKADVQVFSGNVERTTANGHKRKLRVSSNLPPTRKFT